MKDLLAFFSTVKMMKFRHLELKSQIVVNHSEKY